MRIILRIPTTQIGVEAETVDVAIIPIVEVEIGEDNGKITMGDVEIGMVVVKAEEGVLLQRGT